MTCKQLEQIASAWHGKVCLFGAGKIGSTWAYDIITAAGIHIDSYCDNGKPVGVDIRDGVCTISKEDLYALKDSVFVFITVAEKYQEAIKEQLAVNGINNTYSINHASLSYFMDDIMVGDDGQKIAQYKCVTDDATFLKTYFKKSLGYELNLENPKTFNETLQWLKLYDRNPEYTKMVDKAEVKKYVAGIIGEEHIIPTLGVYDSFDEINFDKLPERFVLKCTHDSGSVVICRDKNSFDKEAAREKLTKALGVNLFWYGREWPYKYVKPRIIAERYLDGDDTGDLHDYKFFCFNSVVKALEVIQNRFVCKKKKEKDVFDSNFNLLPIQYGCPNSSVSPKRPKYFNKMLEISKKLSEKIPHVRCDFYESNDELFFGELTFFTGSGFLPFSPDSWDEKFGEWIDLSGAYGQETKPPVLKV